MEITIKVLNLIRVSDFTVWDCFHVGCFSKELDNDKGATQVLVHTDKGRKIFDEIKSDFRYIQASPEAIVDGAKEMRESIAPNRYRQDFFEDAKKWTERSCFKNIFRIHFGLKWNTASDGSVTG